MGQNNNDQGRDTTAALQVQSTLVIRMSMPNDLKLPDLDLPGVPIVASAWHASVGQRVVEGDRLLEVVAADVVVDLPAPVTGVLVERCVNTDDHLEVGQILARVQSD
jgi:pyruvate/2-oxoglutarate dehydrogenase complex dihydrolipoamide acyltransferase (E2) component